MTSIPRAAPVPPVPPPALLSGRRARLAVAIIALAAFSSALMQTLVVPLLVEFPRLLGADPTTVSWLVTAMLLSGAVSNVVFGRLGDMHGKRRIMLVCLSFLVAGSLLGACTDDVAWLIVARAMQGVTIAVIPLGVSCLGELLEKGAPLVKSITFISALAGMGASLGYTLSAVLAQFFDWHALFGVSAALGLLSMLGIWLFVPARPGSGARALDWPGAFGIALGLAGVLLGVSKGSQWGWAALPTWLCLLGGIAVLLLWGRYQLSARAPLVDLRVAAHPAILFTNLSTILVGFAMYGTVLTLSQLVQLPAATGYGMGLPIIVTGMVFLPGAVISLFMPGLAGWVTGRWGPRATMMAGALSLALGYVVLMLAHATLAALLVAYVFVACGVYFCYGAAPTLIMRSAPAAAAGQANGLNNLARSLGTTSSNAVSVALMTGIAIQVDGQSYPSELSFILIFGICALASLLICVMMSFVRDGRRPAPG